MRHFLRRLVLFLLPLLLMAVAAEVLARRVPNTKKFKRALVLEKGHRTKMAILGNSVAEDGLAPNLLGDSTYNYALSGQPLRFTLRFYQKYLDTLRQLRHVILGENYNILFYDAYRSPFADHTELYRQEQLSSYRIYMGLYDDRNPLHYSELLSCPSRVHAKLVRCLLGQPTLQSDSLGRYTGSPYASSHHSAEELLADAQNFIAQNRITDTALLLEIFQENLRFLDTLAMSTAAKGIRLDLLLLPVGPNCLPLYDTLILARTFRAFEACAKKYPNVHFHNYLRDLTLPPQYFADANHLNCDSGATAFSRIVRRDLGLE